MSTLRTVTKNTFLYTLSTVLQRASSIIFFPIFSYYLTKGDYGIQSMIFLVSQFVTIISGFELTRTATRLIHEGDNVEAKAKEIYGTYLITIFSMNVLMGLLLLLIGPWAMAPFLNDIPFYPYIVLTLCTLPFVATYNLFKNYLQATHQGSRFVKIDFLFFLCNVGLNLFFIIVFNLGVAGILVGTLVSSFSFSIFAYFTFFRHTRLKLDMSILQEGLRFSLPLIPFILLGLFMDNADRMMLNAKIGKDAGGILYIASMMAAFFTVLRESCNQALIPWFYQQYAKLSKAYIHRVVYAAFAGLAIIAIGISWFSYEILLVLSSNRDLIKAYQYTPIIVNTALVVFLSQIFNMTVMYFKTNVRYLFITSFVGVTVNVLLSLILIDRFGIYGAAVSNFFGMFMMTLTSGILSHRSGFAMNYGYFLLVILVSVALSLFALLPIDFWIMFALKVIIVIGMIWGYYTYLSKHFPIREIMVTRLQPLLSRFQKN